MYKIFCSFSLDWKKKRSSVLLNHVTIIHNNSDGQTSKSSSKMFKMAGENGGPNDKDSNHLEEKMIDKMTMIADAVSNLQKGQKQFRSSFDN